VIALVLCALCACGGGATDATTDTAPIAPTKDAIAKTTENGPVKATVTVWPGKPALGDAIYLRLTVDAPAGISVDAPFQEAGDQKMGRFKVVGFTRNASRKADGGQVQEQTYTLEAPASGKMRVPPLRLEMIDARAGSAGSAGAAAAQEILTEEVPLDVAPVADAQISAELRGARGPLDADVGGVPWSYVIGGISLLAVLFAGGTLAFRAFVTRRRVALQRNAYDDAVLRLRALETRGAPEAEAADGWFVELSSIVRAYVEQRYRIRAPELTTEEFLQVAVAAAAMSDDQRALLSQFLERCDRVKFAGYRPDAEESITTLKAARGFVEDTRLREDAATSAAATSTPAKKKAAA
jgi:hypothetical protein